MFIIVHCHVEVVFSDVRESLGCEGADSGAGGAGGHG